MFKQKICDSICKNSIIRVALFKILWIVSAVLYLISSIKNLNFFILKVVIKLPNVIHGKYCFIP